MKAVRFAAHGGVGNLALDEVPRPEPGPGEVVVRLRTAALNHLDLFVLEGMPGVPIPLPHVGGADGAGVVSECGPGVEFWRPGDEVVINPGVWCGACDACRRGEESLCPSFRVLGEHVDGTFAEFVRVRAGALAPRPPHLSWEEAAAFPLTWLTAWRMLVTRARLAGGETVLIHGIGGGVALAALAIAARLGARVVVTSSDDTKLDRARALGAAETLNYTRDDIVREVRRLTGKRGADVVVETVGAATWLQSLRSAARGGRIVTCGATSGPNPAEEIRLIFWNQLSILGSTMGSVADWTAMLAAVGEWRARPVVDSVCELGEAHSAYERLAQGRHLGKIVLRCAPESGKA